MKCISEILIRKIIIERKKPINSEKNESKIDYIPIQIAIANLFYTLILFSTQTLGDSGFFQTSSYQGIVKSTVSGVFEDLTFKISEGYKQN